MGGLESYNKGGAAVFTGSRFPLTRRILMGRTADVSGYTQREIELWEKIRSSQGTLFYTKKGLSFRIETRGNELFVDRRKKSITRASVNMAYGKWLENPDCGPKALGVFGASYLWSVFRTVENGETQA